MRLAIGGHQSIAAEIVVTGDVCRTKVTPVSPEGFILLLCWLELMVPGNSRKQQRRLAASPSARGNGRKELHLLALLRLPQTLVCPIWNKTAQQVWLRIDLAPVGPQ